DHHEDPWKRAEDLEKHFFEDVSDQRLIPHLQLHEYEALIFTDVTCLSKFYPKRKRDLHELGKRIKKQFKSPEEVNRITPPSWRIREVVPEYQKPLFGVSAVMDLGIDTVRRECKHFDMWLKKLEWSSKVV